MLLAPSLRSFARHLFRVCLALAATGAALAQSTGITAADGFDPNINGNVFVLTALADGKILAAGLFGIAAPNGGEAFPRSNIARFNPDGTFDHSFSPDVDGAIRAVAVQPNGQILIGGDFNKVNGVARNKLARLNVDGSLDTNFTAGVSTSTELPVTPQVLSIAIQSDGKVLVGGTFGSVTASTTTTARKNLARFTTSGAVDTTFNPNPDGMILSLAVQPDGKILAGGGFTKFNENGSTTDTLRSHLARINVNGTVDTGFDPQANNGVTSISLERDGKILIGGYFTKLKPNGADTPDRNHIARLNTDGTLDTQFYPSVGGNVTAILLTPDGGIVVGGRFSQVWGRGGVAFTRPFVARFTSDGTVDDAFAPGVNGEVDALATQPDGKIVFGGYFTRAKAPGMTADLIRNHIARVLPNGSLDAGFQIDEGGRILATATQSSGKIVVAGSFSNYDGELHNFIARLNANGTIDSSFNTQLNGSVYTMSVHNGADANKDKIMIGGAFTLITKGDSIDTRNHIARLNADGSVDQTFTPSIDGLVGSIVEDKNGNFLVGGLFTYVAPTGESTVTARNNLLRFDSNGHLDTKFDPSPNTGVSGIALQGDGKIVLVGTFTYFLPNGSGSYVQRNFIARLNADGSVDDRYAPSLNDVANTVVIQPGDDKAIIGGRFQKLLPHGATDPVDRPYLARLNSDGTLDTTFNPKPNGMVIITALQSDKKILVGGAFTTLQPEGDANATTVRYAARLTPEGKIDTTFNLDLPEGPGQRVDSLAVQSNGDILVGGTFSSLAPAGSTRAFLPHLARIQQSGARDVAFTPGSGSSSAPVVRAVAIQSDGRILVGGKFATVGASTSSNLARFNPEGSPDTGFNFAMSTDGAGVNALAVRASGATQPAQLGGFAWLNANGTFHSSFAPAIATQGRINSILQLDGSLIVAGNFSITGQASGNVLKFTADGRQDTSFNVTVSGTVQRMVREPDGDIVLAGSFNSVNGTVRNNLARIKANGTLDEAFDPSPNGEIDALVLQKDGSIVIGGAFTALTPNSTATTTIRNYLARVTSAGVVDANFNPNPNSNVYALALDSSDRIIAGGAFTAAQPNGATSSTTRNRIARFQATGELDTGFTADVNNFVTSIAIDPTNQSMVIGGAFTRVNDVKHGGIARLGTDGTPDASFTPQTNAVVYGLSIAQDGSVLVGGTFTGVATSGSDTVIARNHVARFTRAGELDLTFNPDLSGPVYAIEVASDNSMLIGGVFSSLQASGTTLVGGSFSSIGGVPRANLAQLNSDGSITASFQPNPDGAVNAVVPLANGGFVVGGSFSKIAGSPKPGLARFKSDATLDSSFNPASSGPVTALAIQTDGKTIVGSGSGLVRLTVDGSKDTSFNPAVPFFSALAIAVQPDGRVLVAGPGSGVPTRLVRLNADGSVDSSFAEVKADIQALALQTDGSILVAGAFTNIGGSGISRLARLNSSGTVDTSFNVSVNNTVSALAVQSDGRVFLGGTFTKVGDYLRLGLARVASDRSATQTLGVLESGKTIVWLRRGSGAQLSAVAFEQSSDGASWTSLGEGTRVAGGSDWTLSGVSIPTTGATTYIRARGVAPSSAGVSSGIYETVRQINFTTSNAGAATTIAPVVNATPNIYWTLDSAGVFRQVDVNTSVAADKIVLGGVSIPQTSAAAGGLADISTRAVVSPTTPLIGGFAIKGTASRSVLIRAIGPGLAPFDVPTYLHNPKLVVYNSDGSLLAEKTGWDASLAAVFVRTGAFPLTPGSADCAMLTTLAPGNYTVHVVDANASSTGGDTLVEVYDAGDLNDRSSRVVNLSSRGTVRADGSLIGGLVISGSTARTLLVRGVGPALSKYNVGSPLADPVVTVRDAAGHVVVSNDNWQVSNQPTIPELDFGAAMSAAAASVGAFQFDSGSKDAALAVTLQSGAYTIQVSGPAGSSGAAMIEFYELQ